MKKMIAAALVLVSSSAFAITDATSLTCSDAIAAVQRNGFQNFAASNADGYITVYASSNDLKGSFVTGYKVSQAWMATADTTQCPVGFYVRPADINGN